MKCAICGFFRQTIDLLIWTKRGWAHRQCAKGRN